MWLQHLDIKNVRNLRDVNLSPSPRFNIVCGLNGSGKTSLLEAVYLLSCGKSFRTHRFSSIPTQQSNWMCVYAKLSLTDKKTISLGLEHRDGKNLIKAEGIRLNKASELANYLPIVAIHQESQRVFTQSPKYRRGFIDWGVFHVEHDFLSTWKTFTRSLKQRNAALAQHHNAGTVEHWNTQLSNSAKLIDDYRRQYIDEFSSLFSQYAKELLSLGDPVQIDYRRGWNDKEDYLNVLNQSIERDRIMGYTQKGPHRADIVFKYKGVPLHEYVSRGEQKLLVCSLFITQAALYTKLAQKRTVFIVDDLAAELDQLHIDKLLALLYELESQVFLSTPDRDLLNTSKFPDSKVFHVEHGQVAEVL